MAEKINKLAITVDLSCRCCYKKIQKVLCKLQERGEKITTISYDEKKNTVTVSGPFNPHELSKKLWCKACKVIKNIEIIPDPPPPKPQPKPDPKPPPPKVEPCKVINDVQITVCDHHKDPKCCVQTSCKPKETEPKKDDKDKKTETPKKECCKVINDIEIIVMNPKCCDKKTKDDKKPKDSEKKPEKGPDEAKKKCKEEAKTCPKPPVTCYPPVVPVCCMMPCHVGCQGGSRCYSCGKFCGCATGGPPLLHGGTSHGGFQFFCEEDPPPSCTIM